MGESLRHPVQDMPPRPERLQPRVPFPGQRCRLTEVIVLELAHWRHELMMSPNWIAQTLAARPYDQIPQ